MELFDYMVGKAENRLPKDGILNYYGKLLPEEHANHYMDILHINL